MSDRRRKRVPMDPREGRARMWQSMRVLRTFTVADMQATAEVSRASATHYVRALRDAGYVVSAGSKPRGSRSEFIAYRLVRNTGPYGPRVARDGSVFDPNVEPTFKPPTVSIAQTEYERALRCIRLCESLRATADDTTLRDRAARALQVVR